MLRIIGSRKIEWSSPEFIPLKFEGTDCKWSAREPWFKLEMHLSGECIGRIQCTSDSVTNRNLWRRPLDGCEKILIFHWWDMYEETLNFNFNLWESVLIKNHFPAKLYCRWLWMPPFPSSCMLPSERFRELPHIKLRNSSSSFIHLIGMHAKRAFYLLMVMHA